MFSLQSLIYLPTFSNIDYFMKQSKKAIKILNAKLYVLH